MHGGKRNHSSEVLLLNRVTIVGGPESQWKAQYLIFEKLREEVLQNISVLTEPQLQTSIREAIIHQ